MEEVDRVYAKGILGAWDAGDDLDECRLEQATDAAGDGVKPLTTDGSGGNYDSDTPVDADGDTVVLEARAENLDQANGFTHVRLFVGEGGNTGVDNITGLLVRYAARTRQAQREAAAVAGSVVYVAPTV